MKQFKRQNEKYGLHIEKWVDENFGAFIKAEPFYRESYVAEDFVLQDNQLLFITEGKFEVPDDTEANQFSINVHSNFKDFFTFKAPIAAIEPNATKHYKSLGVYTNFFIQKIDGVAPNISFLSMLGWLITFKPDPLKVLKVEQSPDNLNHIRVWLNGYVEPAIIGSTIGIYVASTDIKLVDISDSPSFIEIEPNVFDIGHAALPPDNYYIIPNYGFFKPNNTSQRDLNELSIQQYKSDNLTFTEV